MNEERIARLERRLHRERSSREQAERIAEEGMRRLFLANETLDARVAERTQELELERVAAARSAGERAEFLRLLSRETRSPLNGVIGVMEVLSTNAESEQARAWVADGLESASKLDSIMTRLLLFLELEEDHAAPMGSVAVDDVIAEVNAKWKHEALRSGLLLTTENRCPGGHCFWGHVSDVHAIFDEVISNAIKHGDPGLLEVVSAPAEALSNDDIGGVMFSVSDSGPGIKDVAPLLDSAFRDYSNSEARGMGYSLIKRLADRTGAIVDVESSLTGGTAVRFRLPLTP